MASPGGRAVNESAGWSPGSSSGSTIERVTEGMTVVDAAGDRVGKVEYVQMGDPQATTTEGSEPNVGEPGLLGALGRAIGGDESEPDVPEPGRSTLLRYGFLKVDGPGLTGTDCYVRSDLIGSVSEDTVTLRVNKDQLPRES